MVTAERLAKTLMARAHQSLGLAPRERSIDPYTTVLTDAVAGKWDRPGDEEFDAMLSALWLKSESSADPIPA